MNIKDLYRQVILEHAQNPRNKALENIEKGYLKKRGYNPSCGDDIVIFLKVKDNMVEDIKQYCSGCSICCASTSIATEATKGKSVEDVKETINNFLGLIKGQDYNKDILKGDMLALEGVKDFPARINCASLSWITILDMLKDIENE